MSFKAKLSVAGKDYNLLECTYELKQEVDVTGRPSSVTRGGQIRLVLESIAETDIFEWMCNNFERKDGTITFFKRDSDAKLRELKFTEGYLVYFKEIFDSVGSDPFRTEAVISACKIEMGNGTHNNEWIAQ